jgi:O-antigen ligase
MPLLRWLLIALVVYIPNQLHFPADLGLKGLNVLNLLMLATIACMLVTGTRSSTPTPLRWRILVLWITLTIAFFVGQAHADADLARDLTYLKTILTYMLLYFIAFHAVEDLRTVRVLIVAVLAVAFVASLEVIREGLAWGLGSFVERHRSSGPFGHDYRNANRAGVYFAMFAPMLFATALYLRGARRLRAAALAAGATAVFAVFFTYSRQAILIVAIGLVCLLLRRSLWTAVAIGLLAANYSLWAPSSVTERMEMTYEVDEEGEERMEESAESRTVIWTGAWEIIKENPFGVGLGRFPDEIFAHYGQKKDAHNQYILVTTEAGVQGLAALLAVMIGMLGIGLRTVRVADDDESRAVGYGFAVSSFSMMLGNIYSSPFFYGEVMGDYWILTALVARYHLLRSEPAADRALEAA